MSCYQVNPARKYFNFGGRIPPLQFEETPAEMAALIRTEVVPISEKQPIVGSSIFTTQAGLHQTGIQRQSQAEGGLLYLPFAPETLGRRGVELNRIGALSGMDGIISVLNRQQEASGIQKPKLTGASKLVKFVYDRVHEAYDGRYDPTQNRYVDYRTTFFEVEELARMTEQFQAGQSEPLK